MYKNLNGTPTQDQLDAVFLAPDDRRIVADAKKTVYEATNVLYPQHLRTTLSFAAYSIGAMSFWGSFIFIFFFGTGVVAVPFNQFIQWADRPRPMKDEGSFKKEKDRLAK